MNTEVFAKTRKVQLVRIHLQKAHLEVILGEVAEAFTAKKKIVFTNISFLFLSLVE